MTTVSELVDKGDIPEQRKKHVKSLLHSLGYAAGSAVGKAFVKLTKKDMTDAGVSIADANAILAEVESLQGSSVGGVAAQNTVRKWGSNMVNVKVRGETAFSPVQLYLAAGESDQATSGHVYMDNIRAMMHGPPADVPVMVCEDIHASRMKGALLYRDVNDLSQKQFTAGSELIVWPGTLDASMLQMVQSAYNMLSSNCQHISALLTVGTKYSKED